jgi:hypothetical protein
MVTLETLLDVVPVVSLVVVLSYYTLTVRNQNRTRQAQLLMNLYETYRSPEFRKQQMIIQNLEYTDFEDFIEKYGSETNPESWAIWFSVAAFFNGVGVLVGRNLLDIGLVEELLGNITDRMWTVMGPVLIEWRRQSVTQKMRKYELLHGFEYLYDQMRSRGTF